MEALRAEVSGTLQPGDELVAVGAIALACTEQLMREQDPFLRTHFSPSFLREAGALREKFGTTDPVKESALWKAANANGANACVEIGEDGFLAALWKIAEVSQVGLHADLRKIPIRQETIEICECFDVNPYEAPSGSAFLAGFTHAHAFLEECEREGIPACLIGTTNAGNDRLLYSGDTCRYLDRPRKK